MGPSVVVVVVASTVVCDFPDELTVVARLSLLVYPYMGLGVASCLVTCIIVCLAQKGC
jgi:hypothetical protein